MTMALAIEELSEKVYQALRQDGCADVSDFEVVRLPNAADGQRNWDIGFRGPHPAPQHLRRLMVSVQIRLGRRFQLLTDA